MGAQTDLLLLAITASASIYFYWKVGKLDKKLATYSGLFEYLEKLDEENEKLKKLIKLARELCVCGGVERAKKKLK